MADSRANAAAVAAANGAANGDRSSVGGSVVPAVVGAASDGGSVFVVYELAGAGVDVVIPVGVVGVFLLVGLVLLLRRRYG
ncbi:MAG: hypothetical protein B5766_00215 [Candidatus Lumbricidophila eiseniae]|uniref:Uncharacterized protein n=1 Tax=Candidatus Lumbricidiphila eiseniae TaxID=1969409 RepID=A0A2A6FV44_9MICO|nr:MAG: hypothetical protein B5766_00215 [Candidatus Lumbricidophila eiseniae]